MLELTVWLPSLPGRAGADAELALGVATGGRHAAIRLGLPPPSEQASEVDPERGAGLTTSPFLRVASRTRRARFLSPRHSPGGYVASLIAQRQPGPVTRLALEEPPAPAARGPLRRTACRHPGSWCLP